MTDSPNLFKIMPTIDVKQEWFDAGIIVGTMDSQTKSLDNTLTLLMLPDWIKTEADIPVEYAAFKDVFIANKPYMTLDEARVEMLKPEWKHDDLI